MADIGSRHWPGLSGEMAGRIRAHDWASTPLGPIQNWSQSLKTVCDLMLCSRQPVYVAYGPEFTSLYNDGYIPILGTKHPKGLGQPYAEVWPELWDQSQPMMEAILASEAQHFVDHPVGLAGRLDRAISWFTFSWTPLRDEAGVVNGFYCSVTETTDQVLAQKALQESEERLRFCLKGAEAAAWQWDITKNKQVWSSESYEFHGRDPELGPPNYEDWLQSLHPDDRARVERAVWEAVERKSPEYRTEYRVLRPSGEVRWLDAAGKVEYGPDGKPLRMSGINLDITARKTTEKALEESEELLRCIIEHVPVPILLSREDRKILLANPALTKLTGYTASDIPTRDEWEACAYRENAHNIREAVRAIFEEDVPTDRGEHWIHTKTGGKRLWAINTAPAGRDASGKRLMVSVGLDITERKRSEEEAHAAVAGALRLEAVGQLAGGVAHDFNNLLAVIAGNLELAEALISDETARDLIRRAYNAAERGSGLNRRLLSLTRTRTLKPQRIDLNTRVEEIAKLLQATLGERIDVGMELAAGLWMTLADPGEVDSAILNIAANARDAMPNGGRIQISTRNVAIGAAEAGTLHQDARPGDHVQLTISDDGAGMSEDVLRKATEPFFTTKGSGAGTGLGLASVASFARQTGGFIAIASAPGCGCSVSLYLARSPEDAPAPERVEDRLPVGDGQLVLVVEDDDQVREVTLRRIESLGYSVREARTGLEAVQRLQSGEPVELVLSDIVMPGGMTGYDVARWVASNKPETQVILCSGYNDEEFQNKDKPLQDVTVLGKPYSRDHLARALHSAMEASKAHLEGRAQTLAMEACIG